MDETAARTRITLYCPPDGDPALTSDEVSLLVSLAAVEDASGLLPSEEGWTPTYSQRGCLYAAREGWIAKKGKVVGRFDFSTDDQNFRRSQIADHCDEQIRLFSKRLGQSAPIGNPTSC